MNDNDNKNKFIILALAVLAAITFYIRIIPLLTLGDASPFTLVAPDDPTYNVHIIEVYMKNLQYPWFDPMTYYPYGLWTNWGPLFRVLCAGACILFGASTQEQIAYVSMFIPPLLATLCVPVAYFAGKLIGDWKTGLLAAIFIAFVGGQFFTRSVAGYIDHHIAESFFSLVFITCYVWAIKNRDKVLISTKNILLPGLPVLATAGSYILFLLVMPTAMLAALAVFIFTCIWMIWQKDKQLMLLNAISFVIVSLVFLIVFPTKVILTVELYTIVHVIVYLVIALTGVVFTLKNKHHQYIIIGIALCGLLLITPIRDFIINSIIGFFGQTQYTVTVQEARGWNLPEAIETFNVAIPLSAIAIFVLLFNIIKSKKAELIFILTWVLLIAAATIQRVRYEYYFAVVAAIMSAYVISKVIDALSEVKFGKPKPYKHQKKPRSGSKLEVPKKVDTPPVYIKHLMMILVLGCVVVFVASSLSTTYGFASNVRMGTTQEWIESMIWMRNNTPEVGLDPKNVYTTEYTYPQERYTYPPEAYGVISWWDYGHLIEYYAERPPNANPFQSGVFGYYGAANFFTTNSEDVALDIADNIGTKYVVTDIEMATGKFWAMATWANLDYSKYQGSLLFNTETQNVFMQPYYETMISRLHVFDGSYVNPTEVVYVEYRAGSPPRAMRAALMNDTKAAYESAAKSTTPVVITGKGLLSPAGELSALKHFKLVHESPNDIGNGMRYVKVFEIVPGYTVKGEGLISTQITTNTGRKFTYSQMSENGTWTLPYTGKYYKSDGTVVNVGTNTGGCATCGRG